MLERIEEPPGVVRVAYVSEGLLRGPESPELSVSGELELVQNFPDFRKVMLPHVSAKIFDNG